MVGRFLHFHLSSGVLQLLTPVAAAGIRAACASLKACVVTHWFVGMAAQTQPALQQGMPHPTRNIDVTRSRTDRVLEKLCSLSSSVGGARRSPCLPVAGADRQVTFVGFAFAVKQQIQLAISVEVVLE
jgi:hypothetical protein